MPLSLDLESELQGDEEDLGPRLAIKRKRASPSPPVEDAPVKNGANVGDEARKSEERRASTKDFAWMDSDDDKEDVASEVPASASSSSYRVVFKAVNIRASPSTTADIAGRKVFGDTIRVRNLSLEERSATSSKARQEEESEVLSNDAGDWVRLYDLSGWMLIRKRDGKVLVEKVVVQDKQERRVERTRSRSEKRQKRRKEVSRSRSNKSRSASSDGPPLPKSIADIHTFSQMVRMAESLKGRIRSMTATELSQFLAASARVKFFDGGMFEVVIPRIQRQLVVPRGAVSRTAPVATASELPRSPFSTEELVTILNSLADLNTFDKDIFDKAVKELAANRFREMTTGHRSRILAAFKKTNYDCSIDQEFHEWLKESEKAERYEEACIKQRMIRGNSSGESGMHAPEGYLRSFICGNSDGMEVRRPQGLNS